LIASLQGVLTRKSPSGIVVDTGGVGYEVLVPLSVLYALPDPGQEVQLIVHTHMRESQILLVGFLRHDEKETFRLLTTVTGIGPKLAVNILSGLPAEELLEAILQQDLARLQRIPGVGKKVAERIVVELKDKAAARELILGDRAVPTPNRQELFSEVLSALLNLGYKQKEAERAVELARKKAGNPGDEGLEPLLKASLRHLMKDG